MSVEPLEHHAALWLMPAADDEARLAAAMTDLANAVEGPRFAPHITVHSGLQASTERIDEGLTALARHTAPLVLTSNGVGHSSAFFRSLYLEIDGGEAFDRLRAAAVAEFELDPQNVWPAHVSLAYAELDEARRQRLVAQVQSLLGAYRFDHLAAVRPAAGEDGWSWVEGWRVICRQPCHGVGEGS